MAKTTGVLRRFEVLLAVGCLLATSGACAGGSSDATATATNEPDATVPAGWEPFDRGAMSGAVPPGWDPYFLTAEEFVSLAKEGLSSVSLSAQMGKVANKLKSSEVPGVVLVVLGGVDGFPNVNLQPCYQGAKPLPAADGREAAKAYGKGSGLTVEVAGEIRMGGKRFALLKVGFTNEYDSYQAFVGSADCVSIATLTTYPGDTAALSDFRTFLSMLKVSH